MGEHKSRLLIFGLPQLSPKHESVASKISSDAWMSVSRVSLRLTFPYLVKILDFALMTKSFGFLATLHFVAKNMPRVVTLLVGVLSLNFGEITIVTSH